jgi:hypothetical protein
LTNTVSKIISDETLNKIITIESGGRPTAKAPTSSATGLFQFIDATWLDMVKDERPDLCKGKTKAQILALRKDPSVSIEIGARFTERNARSLGAGYTDGDLYLAHFLGVGAARQLLRAAPSTAVAGLVGSAAVNANRSILAGKNAGQVRAWAASKMAKAKGDWIAKFYKGAAPADVAHAAPAPADTGPMSGAYNPVTEGVQRSLADMGYQPGFYDGKWGGATRGAVAGFQNDRHMAGTLPVIDDALVAEIAKAKAEGFTRPIAKERAEATSDDLKTIVPEVGAAKKAGFWAKVQGWWSAAFGGVTAGGVASNFMDAKSNVDTVHGWFGDNAGLLVGVGCAVAVIILAIVLAKKASGAASEAAEASTAAFNTGARK